MTRVNKLKGIRLKNGQIVHRAARISRQPRTHDEARAWRIALAGMLALATALGIGRFAFTPVLPMMLHEAVVNLDSAGWLATANYLGYFIGALSCLRIRTDPARMIRLGLAGTILLTLGMGLHPGLEISLGLRFLAGIVSAWTVVFASGWCIQHLTALGLPSLGGIIYAGPGLGILSTGFLAGFMVNARWTSASAWLLFAGLSVLLTLFVWPATRIAPQAVQPVPTTPSPAPTAKREETMKTGGRSTDVTPTTKLEIRLLALVYGLAGFGYIITATFLPVIARQSLPPGSPWPDLFWPLFGISVVIGALSATRLSPARDQRTFLCIAYFMQAAGIAVGLVFPNVAGFALGSILLGVPFTIITLFAVREARRLQPHAANQLIGLLTAVYGIGQISGPPLATFLVKQTGSFSASLLIASLALLSGAIMLGWMKKRFRL